MKILKKIEKFNEEHSDANQQNVWDALAKQWHRYRQRQWKDIEIIINSLGWKPGKILEIGCGNCRNLLTFAQRGFDCYGIDFSKEMLKYAKEFCKKNKIKIKLKKAKAESLPFPNNSFDYVLSIALLHHLKKSEQLKAVNEMFRILKPGGKAIATVWNKLNPKFWKFLFKKETFIPWRIDNKVYRRYYYFFNFWELKKMLKDRGFKIVKSSSIFSRNIILVIKKPLIIRKNF